MKISDELLLQLQKPGRYIGNEINMVKKDIKDIEIRFAFGFPDVYEIGMSYLGLQILYYFLNRRSDTYCERVFAPWVDAKALLKQNNIPLFTLETYDFVKSFDFFGFTLQYEMSYTTILNMLDLSHIPFLSAERDDSYPILCAGGPCSYNPEPLADIFDFFYIGEAEASLDKVLDIYRDCKKQKKSKHEFLKRILHIDGIYVPRFYDVSYKETGEINDITTNIEEAPLVVKKTIVKNLNNTFFPEKLLTPLIEIIHDRASIELFRGCIRGCRFCQAGFIYRPVREKEVDTLLKQSANLLESSGHEEISLLSLSTCDYTHFRELTTLLLEKYSGEKINISLPSLRVDAFTTSLMEKIQTVRKSGLTFAPEAGTQRLRDVINKGINENEILAGSKMVFEAGISKAKLYFMIGLPTETNDDLQGIATLCEKILNEYYSVDKQKRGKDVTITASAACFVPKPFTPFQWVKQDTMQSFQEKQRYVKAQFTRKQIKFNYHDPKLSLIEGVLARGDRRLTKTIIKAWELGADLEGWSEYFQYEIWEKAFSETSVEPGFYIHRERELTEVLPWDHISIGVSKEFLVQEYEKAQREQITPNCREKCSNCGAITFEGGVCYEK